MYIYVVYMESECRIRLPKNAHKASENLLENEWNTLGKLLDFFSKTSVGTLILANRVVQSLRGCYCRTSVWRRWLNAMAQPTGRSLLAVFRVGRSCTVSIAGRNFSTRSSSKDPGRKRWCCDGQYVLKGASILRPFLTLRFKPACVWGTPLPPLLLPCPYPSSSFAFCYIFSFSFSHPLYLFSSSVHPIPFYQNSPTPFPGT